MAPETRSAGWRATTAVAWTTGKRAVRSGVLWGALFGLMVWNEALSYHTNFPTVASRQAFAQSFGSNTGMAAIIGPGRRLDTIEGFVAWRMFGLMVIVGAVWGLLTATRALRGEEDAGRWELLLAGRTSRRHAAAQGLAGLASGLAALWAVTAALTVAAGARSTVGFPVSASLFYATAGTATAAIFLAIGALTSQLSPTRRQANALAAAVLGVCFGIRLVADSVAGLAWLRWASPLGWVENLRPLTGSQPLALVPIILLVAAGAAAAVAVAGRRDLGAGLLTRPESGQVNPRFLGGPVVLVARLERWVAVAWITSLGLVALVFGLVARVAGEANVGVAPIEQAVGRLGGHAGGAAAWIGYEFLFIAALVAFAAAGQISAVRSEEADGHLDNLLARPVSRTRWLAGRLGFAVLLIVTAGLASGIGGWIGLATRTSDIGLGEMLQAGLNVAVPAVFILGVGSVLFGLLPRLAAPILYGLVLWSFVVEIIGANLTTRQWILDTSVLTHLGPVPASATNWTAVAWLTALGVVAAATGIAAFHRRDLATA
jgi:ABC-2 type transport system permease protein